MFASRPRNRSGSDRFRVQNGKFRVERIGSELAAVGLRVADMWTDPAGDFALTLAVQ